MWIVLLLYIRRGQIMTFHAMTERYEEITVCGKPALFTSNMLPSYPCLLEQRGRATGVCRMAGGTGSYLWQRKTGSSRWGTPCLTYRVWIFAGCVLRGTPCFFVFRPLVRDFQPCYSYIFSAHDGSLCRLSPHMPENQIQFARRTIH